MFDFWQSVWRKDIDDIDSAMQVHANEIIASIHLNFVLRCVIAWFTTYQDILIP